MNPGTTEPPLTRRLGSRSVNNVYRLLGGVRVESIRLVGRVSGVGVDGGKGSQMGNSSIKGRD